MVQYICFLMNLFLLQFFKKDDSDLFDVVNFYIINIISKIFCIIFLIFERAIESAVERMLRSAKGGHPLKPSVNNVLN